MLGRVPEKYVPVLKTNRGAVGQFTVSTKVIISFGARQGGFYYAGDLREAIYRKFQKSPETDPAFVYLDAKSLAKEESTYWQPMPALGMKKMQNPHWKAFYRNAMKNARTMIFLLTRQWLESPFCWMELEWYSDLLQSGLDIKSIFVVFRNAYNMLTPGRIISLGRGEFRNVSTIMNKLWTAPRVVRIEVNYLEEQAGKEIVVDETTGIAKAFDRVYLKGGIPTQSEMEMNRILAEVTL